MSDLIKREDAIDAIEGTDWYHQNRNKDMVSGANSDEHQAWYKAGDVYKALKEVPSANRPQGEWIDTGKDPDHSHPLTAIWYRCSECGDGTNTKTNYCPNCGCRMKGADDDTD